MRLLIASLAISFLSGCLDSEPADIIAREAAKDAVRPVLRETLPDVPIEPAVNCVIDNASAEELLQLAQAGVTGRTDSATTQTVSTILRRRGTLECLTTEGLASILR